MMMALRLGRIFAATLQYHRYIAVNTRRQLTANIHNVMQQQQQQQQQHTDKSTTTQEQEVRHHANYADDWWDANGPLRALHALNEIRVPFIRDGLVARGTINPKLVNTTRVLSEQKILDVGCGGGLLTEQLARLGATVTGIDLGEQLINVARCHLEKEDAKLGQRITYKNEALEVHVQERLNHYDAVVVSEVLEHVNDKAALLTACVQTLKPGGSIFITTLNRTLPMWLGGVVLGEYVLNLAPKGTHHWDKMVPPIEVQRILDALNCPLVLLNGSTYDFLRNRWHWINTTSMCYAMQAVKVEAS